MEKRYGVIIARMQPIHNGHIELIRQAVNDNDEVLILLGSSNKLNSRNPIPVELRHQMVEDTLKELEWDNIVKVIDLPDLTDESDNSHDWGFYLYTSIIKEINSPYFTLYYSDGYEIITSWFPRFVTQNFVSMKLNARGSIHSGLSATEIRKRITETRQYPEGEIFTSISDNEETRREEFNNYWIQYVPFSVFNNMEQIKNYIKIFSNIS